MLVWTAPGDDGGSGRAARYDLRYSSNAIAPGDTLRWWDNASVVNTGNIAPSPAGAPDSLGISGLTAGQRYYALLRAADDAGNWSPFSNVAVIDLSTTPTSVASGSEGAPRVLAGAPFPSPTRSAAQIEVTLAQAEEIFAQLVDVHGRIVRVVHQGRLEAGAHLLRWDGLLDSGTRAASGVYWFRIAASGVTKLAKVVLSR